MQSQHNQFAKLPESNSREPYAAYNKRARTTFNQRTEFIPMPAVPQSAAQLPTINSPHLFVMPDGQCHLLPPNGAYQFIYTQQPHNAPNIQTAQVYGPPAGGATLSPQLSNLLPPPFPSLPTLQVSPDTVANAELDLKLKASMVQFLSQTLIDIHGQYLHHYKNLSTMHSTDCCYTHVKGIVNALTSHMHNVKCSLEHELEALRVLVVTFEPLLTLANDELESAKVTYLGINYIKDLYTSIAI